MLDLTANAIVYAISALIIVFACHMAWALNRADCANAFGRAGFVVIGIGLVIAIIYSYTPILAALRANVFFVQPLMILSMIVFLVVIGASERGRSYFQASSLQPIITTYLWRAVFGGCLLALGLNSGLPPAFFWSAALGDIAIGIWALAIWMRLPSVSTLELKAWNSFGLLDLLHVLALGAINLNAFYGANPQIAPLTLLPLFGVPLFIAMHIHLYRTISARSARLGRTPACGPCAQRTAGELTSCARKIMDCA